jgi:hypothetical protein
MANLFGKLKELSSTFETDYESVLLAAVDRLFSKKVPTGDSILEGEILKTVNTQPDTSIRSIPIENPSPNVAEVDSNSTASDKPIVIELKPAAVLVNPTDATSGKVTTAEIEKSQLAPANTTTVNNTSISNSLPSQSAVTASNSSVNSSNLLIDSSQKIMESINSLTKNSMESINLVTKNSNVTDAINSLTKNSLTAVTNNSENLKVKSSNLSTLESSMLATIKADSAPNSKISDTSSSINTTEDKETINNNLTQLKSSKLIDSSNVKKILAPDKTLEKSVTSLSKSLPEAVNNLSNSVTSISPQTNTSTSVMNEGSKIDQSSQTTINNPNTGNSSTAALTDDKPAVVAPGINNEYYLQAIYSALMSGKIKVTLGYQ